METITVDNLTFQVRRSEGRKTLGVMIRRDGTLEVAVPQACSQAAIATAILSKTVQIQTKLSRHELLYHDPMLKAYVPGEGFFFLGTSYRLRLVDGADQPSHMLDWHHDWFWLRRDAVSHGADIFRQWYIQQGQAWLPERLARWSTHVGTPIPAFEIRELGYRWGSCSTVGKVHFHWRMMQLPSPIIDYIVAHEVAHLLAPLHDKNFWNILDRVLPDYHEHKQWLAEQGGRFA